MSWPNITSGKKGEREKEGKVYRQWEPEGKREHGIWSCIVIMIHVVLSWKTTLWNMSWLCAKGMVKKSRYWQPKYQQTSLYSDGTARNGQWMWDHKVTNSPIHTQLPSTPQQQPTEFNAAADQQNPWPMRRVWSDIKHHVPTFDHMIHFPLLKGRARQCH